jgi:hypothetical protein
MQTLINWRSTMDVRDATPEEQAEWFETDYFMKGDFSPMQLFVVIPAVIQIVVFFSMLGVFALNSVLF